MFGGLIASGWLTAALTMRLLIEGGAPFADGVIGAGGELAWPRPVRPGDSLRIEGRGAENRALALPPGSRNRDLPRLHDLQSEQ